MSRFWNILTFSLKSMNMVEDQHLEEAGETMPVLERDLTDVRAKVSMSDFSSALKSSK